MPNILKDDSNNPIPQYQSEDGSHFEPTKGKDGAIFMQLTGSNVTDAQALPTRQAGTTALVNGSVTIGATQTELKVGGTQLTGRTQLLIYPPSAGVIYWGATGVTAANGAPLAAGSAPLAFSLDPNTPLSIFAINDGTNRDVKVVEAK